ncbi:hypothetical protein RRG08_063483 [Elysia crispata]|uniref:Uncharacterized protein n=1 Tax=Elysia crispata TaxID=231223 RepID=A0AAE1ABX1_9GAST|nr:hypothetical protein RRG08_063483 [Elysia crispata]
MRKTKLPWTMMYRWNSFMPSGVSSMNGEPGVECPPPPQTFLTFSHEPHRPGWSCFAAVTFVLQQEVDQWTSPVLPWSKICEHPPARDLTSFFLFSPLGSYLVCVEITCIDKILRPTFSMITLSTQAGHVINITSVAIHSFIHATQ